MRREGRREGGKEGRKEGGRERKKEGCREVGKERGKKGSMFFIMKWKGGRNSDRESA